MIGFESFYGRKDRIFCDKPELIENYDKAIADTTQIWCCHHRMEKYFPQKTLIAIGWYYYCEPEELIFLTPSEHTILHNSLREYKSPSKETRHKNGSACRGKVAYTTPDGNRVYLQKDEPVPNGYIKGYAKNKGKLPPNYKKFKEARWYKQV